jgi:alpha-tubulin suppressor-like RCC1 family protein
VTAPASVPNLLFATIAAGRTHTCGLTTSGDAYCWGDNRYGELGDGSTTSSGIPVRVAGGHSFATISVGENLTCALGTDAVGYCWGSGSYGGLGVGAVPDLCYDQLGRNGAPCAMLPTPLAGGMTYASVDASVFAGGCAVTTSGDAYCWGDNEFGAVGDGTVTSSPSPVRVVGASAFTSISAGWTHSCGVVAGGSIYCWGSNRYGELAADTSTVYTSFTARLVVGGADWAAVTAKNDATCAVSVERHLFCWGNNFYGRLGDGTTSNRDVPTLVF